jgi:hypothetical protein
MRITIEDDNLTIAAPTEARAIVIAFDGKETMSAAPEQAIAANALATLDSGHWMVSADLGGAATGEVWCDLRVIVRPESVSDTDILATPPVVQHLVRDGAIPAIPQVHPVEGPCTVAAALIAGGAGTVTGPCVRLIAHPIPDPPL